MKISTKTSSGPSGVGGITSLEKKKKIFTKLGSEHFKHLEIDSLYSAL